MSPPQSFAAYLMAAREERGLSIREVARRLSVAATAVSRLEDGTRGVMPHPDLLIGLIHELGLHWRTTVEFFPPYARLWNELTTLALDEHGTGLRDHVNTVAEDK